MQVGGKMKEDLPLPACIAVGSALSEPEFGIKSNNGARILATPY
jgi:hypothetical protein